MINNLLNGFNDELEKIAGLIPKQTFAKLDSYDQKKLVEAKEAIHHATDPKVKLSKSVREKVIEAAFDTVKNKSYSLASAATGDGDKCCESPVSVNKPAKKKVYKL